MEGLIVEDEESYGWCTIESDPAVFSALIRELGVEGTQVEEVYGLDDDSLRNILIPGQKIYGFIFLHKWSSLKDTRPFSRVKCDDSIFFARQTVSNACATQAILSIILSSRSDTNLKLGPHMSSFLNFTQDLDPEMRGEAIGASDVLRNVHNSFARPEVVLYTDPVLARERRRQRPESEEDSFHFVSFVPYYLSSKSDSEASHEDHLVVELDGLHSCPKVIDVPSKNDWPFSGLTAIREKANTIMKESGAGSEIRFSLMAIVRDRIDLIKERISTISDDQASKETTLTSGERSILEADLADEISKRSQDDIDNIRRRHNFVPLAIELLKAYVSHN